ncbi:MAG TPA: hypothetical protein VIU61_15120, partial [Kofleriaceae bacterium]
MMLPVIAPAAAIDWPALEALLEEIVPARELATTMQDPGFHAEGDVWTHTRMVVEEMAAHDGWRALDDDGRAITFAAALMHDLGK